MISLGPFTIWKVNICVNNIYKYEHIERFNQSLIDPNSLLIFLCLLKQSVSVLFWNALLFELLHVWKCCGELSAPT